MKPRPLLEHDGTIKASNYREITTLIRIVGGLGRFLRIRYLVLFGGAGGGYAASQVTNCHCLVLSSLSYFITTPLFSLSVCKRTIYSSGWMG